LQIFDQSYTPREEARKIFWPLGGPIRFESPPGSRTECGVVSPACPTPRNGQRLGSNDPRLPTLLVWATSISETGACQARPLHIHPATADVACAGPSLLSSYEEDPGRVPRPSAQTCFGLSTRTRQKTASDLLSTARATLQPAAFAISWLAPGPRSSRVPRANRGGRRRGRDARGDSRAGASRPPPRAGGVGASCSALARPACPG
jgi:hypothetical protein